MKKMKAAKKLLLILFSTLWLLAGLVAACGEVTLPTATSSNPAATATAIPPTPTANVTAQPTPSATNSTNSSMPTKTPSPANAIISAEIGTEFTLKFGQIAKIASEKLELKILDVVEDSRCPTNVTCVWSGQLILSVAVSRENKLIGNFDVNSIDAYRNKTKQLFENYSLALHKATPGQFYINPSSGNAQNRPIKLEEYAVDFLLTKLN